MPRERRAAFEKIWFHCFARFVMDAAGASSASDLGRRTGNHDVNGGTICADVQRC